MLVFRLAIERFAPDSGAAWLAHQIGGGSRANNASTGTDGPCLFALRFLISSHDRLGWHGKDRARRRAQHAVSDTAEEYPAHPASSVGADDNEVDTMSSRMTHDYIGGITGFGRHDDRHVAASARDGVGEHPRDVDVTWREDVKDMETSTEPARMERGEADRGLGLLREIGRDEYFAHRGESAPTAHRGSPRSGLIGFTSATIDRFMHQSSA